MTVSDTPALHRRLMGLAVTMPCVAVLAAAGWLQPDARGYNTHTRLGMPPCGLMQTRGLPCPTCGMTTAFSNMAHGRIVPAVQAQAFGAVLFICTVAAALAGSVQVATGREMFTALTNRIWLLWLLLPGIFAGWGLKLALGFADGSLPAH